MTRKPLLVVQENIWTALAGPLVKYLYNSGSIDLQTVTNVGATTTHSIDIGGNIRVGQNVYVNYDGGDGDSYLYFYDNSSETGVYLKWDDTDSNFKFNNLVIKYLYISQESKIMASLFYKIFYKKIH